MSIKRFWAFTGADFEALGGCGDSHASFDTVEAAIAWIQQNGMEWANVHDMLEDVEVASFTIARGPLHYVNGVGVHDRILKRL